MNLFILSENLEENARFHVDKHVVKIIVEAAQVASNAFWNDGVPGPYKQTHVRHPISIWCSNSYANYMWTVNYGLALCDEYTYRYKKIHKTQEKLLYMRDNPPQFSKYVKTPFVLAMPDEYKSDDAVQSYRDYYINEKEHLFSWKNRPIPNWINK